MKTSYWQYQRGVQPRQLVPLLGKRVIGFWVDTEGKMLVVQVESEERYVARFAPGTPIGGFLAAMEIMVGHARPGFQMPEISEGEHKPDMDLILESTFEGIDGAVVMFRLQEGVLVGARLLPCFRWVREGSE